MQLEEIKKLIVTYPDFPQKGVLFRDLSPVLANPEAFKSLIAIAASKLDKDFFDTIVAIDARGFVFGSALALTLGKGLVLCRKKGKLPGEIVTEKYTYEYATAELAIQKDRLQAGNRVWLVDDVLATGNTAVATAQILKRLRIDLIGCLFMVEIDFLQGKEKLGSETTVDSLIHF